MAARGIETQLVKKVAKVPTVCTQCKNQITPGTAYHLEEGKTQHLHSLIARQFCSDCYAKYGARKLLSQK
ncbi:MAG: hypothetical protein JW771_03790 [Candidatus Thermoplasmatota archaeon]|nr:hypothetical protein [Candidatus Thermoplasmatota archaeon]